MAVKVDVAILGGGLAGNLLARQLKRRRPELSVLIVEKETTREFKVGESTVEIAANYLTRKLGLSQYLYHQHLPKNGLRFFFDTDAKDASLPQMSEIGISGLPPAPSFQLDRAKLEADLLVMNRDDGVDVRLGVRAKDLSISETGEHHLTLVDEVGEGGETQVQARWVVDASGRGGLISRQRDIRRPEKNHRVAAAWGRARGVRDIDEMGDDAWRQRVQYTARGLSTNHLCYPGYWIWFIPLRGDLVSVGVVAEASGWDVKRHKPEGLLEHLRTHRAAAELLDGAELVDIGSLTQLAFRTTQFFSDERWAVVGDAGAFVDPFYSPGSDFIAIQNDMVTELVLRDMAGEDWREHRALYDEFMQFRFDVTMLLYQGLYPSLGSYSLFRAKGYFDCAAYYNLWFDGYARDEHLQTRALKAQLRRKDTVLTAMRNFNVLFADTARAMQRDGTYFAQNTGRACVDGRDAFGVIENVGRRRSSLEINARTEAFFNHTLGLLMSECQGQGSVPKHPLEAFAQQDGLAGLMGASA